MWKMRIECTLVKFANDTTPSWEVDTLKGRATQQDDLGRLEKGANKNLKKFDKGKT